MFALPTAYRTRCPHSIFKGRPHAKIGNFTLDSRGYRNSGEKLSQYSDWIVLGSSVVWGHEDASLTDDMEASGQTRLLNVSCPSWTTAQCVKQYIEIVDKIRHGGVMLLAGYNDIFGPLVYDPRPQYPYNFFIDEVIYDHIGAKDTGGGGFEFNLELNLDLSRQKQHKNETLDRYASTIKNASGSQADWNYFESLFSEWLKYLQILKVISAAYSKHLVILPQVTLLDKPKKSNDEKMYIERESKLFEVFDSVRTNIYWPKINANPSVFFDHSVESIIGSSDHQFVDIVHYTRSAQLSFAKSLVEVLKKC